MYEREVPLTLLVTTNALFEIPMLGKSEPSPFWKLEPWACVYQVKKWLAVSSVETAMP